MFGFDQGELRLPACEAPVLAVLHMPSCLVLAKQAKVGSDLFFSEGLGSAFTAQGTFDFIFRHEHCTACAVEADSSNEPEGIPVP